MPYGLFEKKQLSTVRSQFYRTSFSPGSIGSPFTETSSNVRFPEIVPYSSYRAGSNLQPAVPLLYPPVYDIVFKTKRKKMGTRIKIVKKKYFEKSNITGASRLVYKKTKVEVPVFIEVLVPIKQLAKRQPANVLLAPNPLRYENITFGCDRATNTFYKRQQATPQDPFFQESSVTLDGLPPPSLHYEGPSFNMAYYNEPIYQNLNFSCSLLDPRFDELDDEALRRIYKKAASEFPEYMVDVVQSNKTWATLKKIGLAALKTVRAIKRLDVLAAKRVVQGVTPKQLSGLWLEYIYGVAPTIQTINDSIDLYNREARAWRSYKASRRLDVNEVTSMVWPNSIRPFSTSDTRRSLKLVVRYGCIMTGDLSFSRKIRQDNTFTKATGLAYEIVPFSFMLDWIYDIGSVLNSRHIFNEGLLYFWRSRLVEETVLVKHSPIVTGDTTTSFNPFTLTGKRVLFERKILPLPPDMPAPKLKSLNDGLTLQRSVNALAIAIQLKR